MARAGALWTHVLSKSLVDVVRLKKTLARSSQRLFLIDARMRGISTLGHGKLRWLEKITNFPAQLFRLHGQGGRFLWDILPLSAQTHARARADPPANDPPRAHARVRIASDTSGALASRDPRVRTSPRCVRQPPLWQIPRSRCQVSVGVRKVTPDPRPPGGVGAGRARARRAEASRAFAVIALAHARVQTEPARLSHDPGAGIAQDPPLRFSRETFHQLSPLFFLRASPRPRSRLTPPRIPSPRPRRIAQERAFPSPVQPSPPRSTPATRTRDFRGDRSPRIAPLVSLRRHPPRAGQHSTPPTPSAHGAGE